MRRQPDSVLAAHDRIARAGNGSDLSPDGPGRTQTESSLRHKGAIAAMVLLLVVETAVFAPLFSGQRFAYDEADYAYAASRGLWANYLDKGAISTASFLTKGRRGLDSANWSSLAEYIRSADDITFYRHYHGPLYFYPLSLGERFWGTQEKPLRLMSFACLLLCAVVLFAGSILTVPGSGGLAGCLAAFFLLASPICLRTVMGLGPHALFVATAMVALFSMAKLAQSNRISYLYASVIAVAVSFAVIEYALFLLVTLLVVALVYRRALFGHLTSRQALLVVARCVALFLMTIAVIWPGGIFKLTVVKDYLFFLYFTTVRSAAAYGTQSFAQAWRLRGLSSPVELACALAFAAAFVARVVRKRDKKFLLPFVIYASLVFLSTLRNHSQSPVYISSLLPALFVVGAVLLADAWENRNRAARTLAASVIAAFAISGYLYAYRPLSRPTADLVVNRVVEVLQRSGVRSGHVLVPHDYLPTAHFYFSSLEITPYADALTSDQLLHDSAASRADGLVYVGANFPEFQRELSPQPGKTVFIDGSGNSGVDIAYVSLR